MSLLKQVSIVLGFIFLILFVSIIGLSFNIIKDYNIIYKQVNQREMRT